MAFRIQIIKIMKKTNKNQILNKATELLPWYATGKLSNADANFMDDALAAYPELQKQLKVEQSTIQLVKNNPDILNASALESPEDRVNHVLDLLEIPSNTNIQQKENSHNQNEAHSKNKLKQLFEKLFPVSRSFGSYQYAGFALVLFALVAIVHNTFNKPTVIQESVFYPAAKENTAFKNKTQQTVLLLGVNGKLDDPKLLKLLQNVDAEIDAVPEKDGMYRIILGKQLNSITLNALLDKLRAEEELVWFAGESN